MQFLVSFAWRDLRAGGRNLWVFCICLALGVTLVTATGGLYQQVQSALLTDTRALMGGDLEVESVAPLPAQALTWINDNGLVSLLTELDTMMVTEKGDLQLVELQSVDHLYPLYGSLQLDPPDSLDRITGLQQGQWGIALDPVLAERLNIAIGDQVTIGNLTLAVRALIRSQPDRSLRAEWRAAPVMIAADALASAGLFGPGSRVDYEYRVRTDLDPETWRTRFYQAFPDTDWEVHTFAERSERIADRLAQVASGLLIIGFSTLFIGGLGVFNSVYAYLQGKLTTISTLRALGLRNRRLAAVYLLQTGLLAGAACILGAIAGLGIVFMGTALLPVQSAQAQTLSGLGAPILLAVIFGMLTAYTFAIPAIGSALSASPAALFRGVDGSSRAASRGWWLTTLGGCFLIAALVLLTLPDPLFGLGFIIVVSALLGLLMIIVYGLRQLGLRLDDHPALGNRFALRLAVASLHRPGSPLLTSLLSLGSALTLLVACALVVAALLRAINDTIPDQAPALVLYDISKDQRDNVIAAMEGGDDSTRVDIAPLVLGRLQQVNGETLRDSAEAHRRNEARDEHKLSYRGNNIDQVTMERGVWWSDQVSDLPRVVMEDREADQLGLEVGDRLTFSIDARLLEAELTGIYRQKGLQTRFWFEAIFSDGALDPFIHRYVGAAYQSDLAAIEAQQRVARVAPNVVSVRTASILSTARDLLGKASIGLTVIALVSLVVSLLVLSGVMATNRTRQIYEATILHVLGARFKVIRRSLQMEYLLLAVITSVFALIFGAALALPLLIYRLKLESEFALWPGAVVAVVVSTVCLYLGARYLLRRLRVQPASLLRSGG
ncbi:MAG: FtsX-like permease family protein [Arenicellales bacterium]